VFKPPERGAGKENQEEELTPPVGRGEEVTQRPEETSYTLTVAPQALAPRAFETRGRARWVAAGLGRVNAWERRRPALFFSLLGPGKGEEGVSKKRAGVVKAVEEFATL